MQELAELLICIFCPSVGHTHRVPVIKNKVTRK